MNGIEREWFQICIAKGLKQYAKKKSEEAFRAGYMSAKFSYQPTVKEYISKTFPE